ncbi:MAG: NIPSNAP family protein [Parasporobacterium sp.]|nr:NIPSNAP family protein [Parasporobacterium sp.]
MIIDMRTYTHKPDHYRKFLKIYQESGYAITARFLGFNMGLFTRSNEEVNTTIQLFAYEDHDHRDECRRNYLSSMDKQAFTNGEEGADGCIRIQRSICIIPTDFSPIQDRNPDNPVFRDEAVGKRMIEWNTYFIKPGYREEALDIFRDSLYPLADKIVPYTLGYFTSDSGPECIFEMRAYRSLQERTETIKVLREDAAYSQAYKQLSCCLLDFDSNIWEAMPMSPIQ